MVCDRAANQASSAARRKFGFAGATGADSPGTSAAASAAPFPGRNSFASASFDLDTASAPFAALDGLSCWDVSGGGCREVARGSDACCEDSEPQNLARSLAD